MAVNTKHNTYAQQADERALCDQQLVAAVVAAVAESGDDAGRVMLVAGDKDSDADAAVSVCWTLWCCCERTRAAESGACPGRSVFPAQR